jgi:hypothetical protein
MAIMGVSGVDEPNALLSKIEAARLWAYFHKDWLLQIRALIRPQLPPEYYVFVESETILITPDAPDCASASLPDMSVARSRPTAVDDKCQSTVKATAAVIEVDEPCEVFVKYTLLIRRAPENQVVAALEILSPSNKGVANRLDLETHLRKRTSYLEAGVNLIEIDALLEGQRLLPVAMRELSKFERLAWSAFHTAGRRKLRGWGWNADQPLPNIPWSIEQNLEVLVDLGSALDQACEFNRWEELVGSARHQPIVEFRKTPPTN